MKFFSIVFLCLFFVASACATVKVPDIIVTPQDYNPLHRFTFANTTSIDQQVIQRSGAKTVTQLLNHRAGIQVRDLYGDGSHVSLSMRGFGDNAASNVLILIDGQPLLNPDLGTLDFNSLPLDDIQRIDILSGSAGVIYGDQAVAGVVNIITKKPQQFKAAFNLGVGRYASQHYGASIANKINDQLSYQVSAQHLFSKNYRDHNHHQNNQLLGVLYFHNTNNNATLRYRLLQNNLQYPGALTAQQVKNNRRQATNTTDFNSEQKQDVHLSLNHQLNTLWLASVDASYHSMQGDGVLTTPFNESRELLWFNPRITGQVNLLAKQALTTIGMSSSHGYYDLNAGSFRSDSQQDQYAVYADVIMPLAQRLKLNVGIRHAQAEDKLTNLLATQSNHNQATINTLGLQWQALPDLSIYLRRAGNYRFPKADENALSVNNMPLQTQRGYSYEVGGKFQREDYGSELSLYQLDLHNEIIFIPSFNNTNLGSNQNLPQTRRRGMTLSGYVKPISDWRLAAEYDHLNAVFSAGPNRGKRIAFVANNTARLSSDYQVNPRWHIYTEALYTGDRYPAGDQANQSQVLGSFAVYNASVRYRRKRLSIIFRINNIANKHYDSYALVAMRNGLQTFFYPANTRNYWVSVSYVI